MSTAAYSCGVVGGFAAAGHNHPDSALQALSASATSACTHVRVTAFAFWSPAIIAGHDLSTTDWSAVFWAAVNVLCAMTTVSACCTSADSVPVRTTSSAPYNAINASNTNNGHVLASMGALPMPATAFAAKMSVSIGTGAGGAAAGVADMVIQVCVFHCQKNANPSPTSHPHPPLHPPTLLAMAADHAASGLLGISLHFFSPDQQPNYHATPLSTTRRLDERPTTREPGVRGLDGKATDAIAKACFASVQFNPNQTTVLDGTTYYHLSSAADENVRQTLHTLFGVRLSTSELDSNVSALEKLGWGYCQSIENTNLDLSQRIAHAKVAEVALLACASLSPAIVTSVAAVLSSLADSLQSMRSVLQKTTLDCNLFTTTPPSSGDAQSIILINSRFETNQTTSKWILCLCGASRTRMMLSLRIRRVSFNQSFTEALRDDSPIVRRRIHNGNVLLPPSPELHGRSATAPSSVPVRHSSRARHSEQPANALPPPLERSRQSLLTAAADSSRPSSVRPSPLSVVRQLPKPPNEQVARVIEMHRVAG